MSNPSQYKHKLGSHAAETSADASYTIYNGRSYPSSDVYLRKLPANGIAQCYVVSRLATSETEIGGVYLAVGHTI